MPGDPPSVMVANVLEGSAALVTGEAACCCGKGFCEWKNAVGMSQWMQSFVYFMS